MNAQINADENQISFLSAFICVYRRPIKVFYESPRVSKEDLR